MATAKTALKPAPKSKGSVKGQKEPQLELKRSKGRSTSTKISNKEDFDTNLDLKLLLKALLTVKKGNFAVRLPDDWVGISGKIADTFNEVVEMNQILAAELERVGRVVGKEGKITQRVRF